MPLLSLRSRHPDASGQSGFARLMGNLVKLLSGKAVAGLLSLGYLVVVAHQLGAHSYGILMLVNAYAVSVGSIVAFSGFHGVVRYGALAIAGDDRAGLARIIRFMAVLELACGAVAILVAAALVPIVGPRLGWSHDAMRMAVPYSLAILATVRATPQGILQLADRFDLIGLHQTVSPTIRAIGVGIAWALGAGLTGFLAAWLVSSVVEGVAMWLMALPSWHKLLAGERLFGTWRGVLRHEQGFGRFIAITNFDITLRELAPNLTPLTVGWLLGPAAAGLLALVLRATNLLQQPAVLLSQASYAVLAEQAAGARHKMLAGTVWRSTIIAGAIGALIVAALGLWGDKLVTTLGGKSFALAGGMILLVGGGRALALASTPSAAALTALGRPGRSATVALLINLGLYPLLPPLLLWLGVDGAGWHVLLQQMVAFTLLLALFARDIDRA